MSSKRRIFQPTKRQVELNGYKICPHCENWGRPKLTFIRGGKEELCEICVDTVFHEFIVRKPLYAKLMQAYVNGGLRGWLRALEKEEVELDQTVGATVA